MAVRIKILRGIEKRLSFRAAGSKPVSSFVAFNLNVARDPFKFDLAVSLELLEGAEEVAA